MSEALAVLLRLNLAAGAAVLAVMALRIPARHLFGPRIAYGLWALVPLAAAAVLIPQRVVTLPAAPSPDIADLYAPPPVPATLAPPAPAPAVLTGEWLTPSHATSALAALWIAGAALTLLALWRSQARFHHAMRVGRAGPAAIGVLAPRIVTPTDFAALYTSAEQRMVLAHESTHIARQDPRINAAIALARCLAWFNPLIHLLAHAVRIDQEFACDAAVIARFPRARHTYARALLKTQLAAQPLPFGCYWAATHPLIARVDLLGRPLGFVMRRATGLVTISLLTLAGASAVWIARPARFEIAPSHEAVLLARAIRGAALHPLPAAEAPPSVSRAGPSTTPHLIPIALTQAPAPPILQLASSLLAGDEGYAAPDARSDSQIRGAAALSSVAPGTAVRVIATMDDHQGQRLTTDLTAFGSQSLYRMGYVDRGGSRLKLFTRVVQQGDDYVVTASLNGGFAPAVSGSVEVASGGFGSIRLPNGLEVAILVQARPETAEEAAASLTLNGRRVVSVEQLARSY